MKGDSYGFCRNFCSQGFLWFWLFGVFFWGVGVGWGKGVKFPPSGCSEAGKSKDLKKKIGN